MFRVSSTVILSISRLRRGSEVLIEESFLKVSSDNSLFLRIQRYKMFASDVFLAMKERMARSGSVIH